MATSPEFDQAVRDRAIRKIKHCLSLSKSPNPHEAETALRQARKLMDSFRLSELDVALSDVSEVDRDSGYRSLPQWYRALATLAAGNFNCTLLYRNRYGESVKLLFIGVSPASELASYAFETLLVQLQAARKQFVRATKGTHANARNAADSFCMGWIEGVSRNLAAFAAANDTTTEEQSSGKDLVVIAQKEQQAVAHWMANKYPRIKTVRSSEFNMDIEAALAGLSEGANAKLHQAMSGQPTTAALAHDAGAPGMTLLDALKQGIGKLEGSGNTSAPVARVLPGLSLALKICSGLELACDHRGALATLNEDLGLHAGELAPQLDPISPQWLASEIRKLATSSW